MWADKLLWKWLLKRLIFNRCIEFIDKNSILNDRQYGFREHHSTSMAIMQRADKIANAIENHETTIGVAPSLRNLNPYISQQNLSDYIISYSFFTGKL